MRRSVQILIASFCLLSACAPEVKEREFAAPKTTFGPQSQDVDLSGVLKAQGLLKEPLVWKGLIGSATYFEQAENLVTLGELSQSASLKEKGLSWIRNFYLQPKTTTYVHLAETPFATLAAAQTQEEVQKSLTEINDELGQSKALLQQNILRLGEQFPWSKEPQRMDKALAEAKAFVNLVIQSLPKMGLSAMVEEGVKAELEQQTKTLFAEAEPLVQQFYATKEFGDALDLLDQAIVKFEISLEPGLVDSLNEGKKIGAGLKRMNSPQRALTVLIDVWNMLNPAEREANFKTASPDLYDFLAKQDSKELACLRRDGCNGGLFKGIAKKFFILPELKKYGVTKLQRELNQQSLAYVVSSLEKTAHEMVAPPLAQTIAQKVDQGLEGKMKELGNVRGNYISFLKDLLGDWSKKVLAQNQGQVPGFEISALKVDISGDKPMSIQAVGSALELRAHTAGASMAANAVLMNHVRRHDTVGVQSALSQLNKLITIGGYRDHNDKLVPALLAPVGQDRHTLDIMNFASVRNSYRIPDKIRMRDAFHIDGKISYEKNFSASAFAEQIRGLSRMLHVTADWKQTGYDELIGHVKAQDLTDQMQAEALNRSLFPKDMFFALNLGDVAVLLQDITKKATPVFLLTLDKNILWADEYATVNDQTPIMAGIVDIKEGRRSNIVQSQDVAKFLLALFEFLKATEGSDQTKSALLLEKDADGKTAMDTLKEGRSDLKLLVLALGNFISNQLMSDKKLVPAQYYLQQGERANNPEFLVEEQTYAIRALLAAWRTTKIDAYLWAAQDVYYGMNRYMFSAEQGFYVNGNGSVLDFPQITNTLLALQELAPHLPEQSQAQLSQIVRPYLQALEQLK